MDEFQIKTINDITVAKVDLITANALDCYNTLQEAINSYRSEPPIRDIDFNQEFKSIKSALIN